jgi:Tfp pilus assembly protein FimT
MVVIAIVALAAVIAVPNLIAWRTNLRLGSAAGELRADLMSAKTIAAKENTTVTVQFYPATGSYSIKHTNLDGNPVLLKATLLPPGVRIDPESTMTGSKTSFTSRGGADAGTMVLANSAGKKKSISVSSLGKITLKD